jgi:hypothetical protein
MSFATIARAAVDQQLIDRVTASAYQAMMEDPDKIDTVFGQALVNPPVGFGNNPVAPLMWPVAVDSEAAYEAALVAGRGAPGHDTDIITDEAIHASVTGNWPMTRPPGHEEPMAYYNGALVTQSTMAEIHASGTAPTMPTPPAE